jgi:hypothetical protein
VSEEQFIALLAAILQAGSAAGQSIVESDVCIAGARHLYQLSHGVKSKEEANGK